MDNVVFILLCGFSFIEGKSKTDELGKNNTRIESNKKTKNLNDFEDPIDKNNQLLMDLDKQLEEFSLATLTQGKTQFGLKSTSHLYDLDLQTNFNPKGRARKLTLAKSRVRRGGCPSGVGNMGFNSFNFMTFMLLTMNAVANTNNNINNNNNNNVNINYNTINQDSNNLVSNSENTNMISATILPVPGKRSVEYLKKHLADHMSKNCVNSTTTLETIITDEMMTQMQIISREKRPQCRGWRVCNAIKQMMSKFSLDDAIVLDLLEEGQVPFMSMINCAKFFQSCAYM